MDINRYYDYSDYDRDGERNYSENYINRVNRRDNNSDNTSSEYNCSKKYYEYNCSKKYFNNLLKEYYELIDKIDKIKRGIHWLSCAEEETLDKLEKRRKDIDELLPTLKPAEIEVKKNGKVGIGNKVGFLNTLTGKTLEYEIVMPAETDLRHNKISAWTPLARGLLGKNLGDLVDIWVPGGILSVEILYIE